MLSENEVINECLLVNYVTESGKDSAVLIISLSTNATTDIYTFRDEKATTLYSKLMDAITIYEEDFKNECI